MKHSGIENSITSTIFRTLLFLMLTFLKNQIDWMKIEVVILSSISESALFFSTQTLGISIL